MSASVRAHRAHAVTRRRCVASTLPASRAEPNIVMDLSDLIDRNAAFAPDKAAIRFQGRTLTYAAFAERIAAAARALKSQLGIGRGDRVAILSTNHPDYLVLLYACARLGAMLVPLNWRLAVSGAGLHSFRCLGKGAGGRGGASPP